jgi:serine/threonine-protein kinase RsbW
MSSSKTGSDTGSMTVSASADELESLQASVAAALVKHEFGEHALFAIRLAIEEAVMNAIRHGNLSDPSKTVEARWMVSADSAAFHIIDQGEGFDPSAVPDPTLDENLEIPSGRGLMLIRAYMSEVRHHGSGNHLEMIFRREAAA